MGQILIDCCDPVKALSVVFYLYPSHNFVTVFCFKNSNLLYWFKISIYVAPSRSNALGGSLFDGS